MVKRFFDFIISLAALLLLFPQGGQPSLIQRRSAGRDGAAADPHRQEPERQQPP